jgi:hypothetical protein
MGTLWSLVMFLILRQCGRFYPALVPWGKMSGPNFMVAGTTGCILYILAVALHYLLLPLPLLDHQPFQLIQLFQNYPVWIAVN